MQRLICHVDMDAFFVSVEELFNPSLKGKPVVVGGKADQRGVVAAASYVARRFGVHSAMPLRTAARLCPQAVFVDGHPERYRDCSKKVFAVLQRFSPQVEMASIDEAYLDLTGTERLHGPALRAAHSLHAAIGAETKLKCSLGLASSRLVAKVSSDQAKPSGLLYVLPGQEARFLAPLEVRKIPGVGKKTEASLHAIGIRRVGDLARLEENFLARRFGRWGLALAGKALGEDAGGWFDAEIGANEDPKSISHEHTFGEDTKDREQLETTLLRLSEMVARRLREHQLYARTIQLKLRFEDFSTITRARSLDHATQLDSEVAGAVVGLFRLAWDGRALVRLLGVHAGSLEQAEGQMSLLEEPRTARLREAFRSVDHIRDRFGERSVSLAKTLGAGIRERVHENPYDLPGKTAKKKSET
ncbi:MAG TPA: DNA polymerase IV [Bryobacteraceae bacterium]|jgi:DNA polymerase-4|nr:DNA polymerase IV [Bryobacteraceae bacterium]